jgi:hypothetical protein
MWSEVQDWFTPDGSLLDAYIFDTTLADWQRLLDGIRSIGWWHQYSENGTPTRLPPAADLFPDGHLVARLLRVRPSPDLLINVHPFTIDQIEFDIDLLCQTIRAVGRILNKPVILTPESSPSRPLARFDVGTGRADR